MAEHLRLANTEAPPIEAGGFVQTETACSILQSLQLIELIDGPAMTMIAGAPGVGKTRTLEHFAGQYALGEIYLGHVTFKRGEGKPGDVSEVLFQHFRHWDKANGKSLPLRRDLLLSHRCVSRLRVLLADEAQHLLPDGIEWLRGLCEEAGVAVAFVGDLELPRLITGIPQLDSRMRRPVTIRQSTRNDVAAYARAQGQSDPKVINLLLAQAQKKGGLRIVETILHLAKMFAGSDAVSSAHIVAAITDMGLMPKGGGA